VRNETSQNKEDDKESHIKKEEVACPSPFKFIVIFFLTIKGIFVIGLFYIKGSQCDFLKVFAYSVIDERR
jgi:hypothetical protein